ncbi:MAG: GMC family oxidoreductase [Henriciella sp.]|nr:GMC family oxidoreductase [Henriciella sp.]
MSETTEFDVIVVGSGMSGGWAAKEFCEKGFKTLVLERGRSIDPMTDYVGENVPPWEMEFRGEIHPDEINQKYPRQSKCYALNEHTKTFFIDDSENPYSHPEDQPFSWIRGDQVGGRSLMWARQTYRWSDIDFEANKKDGHGVDWPIRYADLAPWYDHCERFVGVSGSIENLPQLPDGPFLPPMEMNCVEKDIKAKLESAFDDRKMIIGRAAHLTEPTEEHLALGRGACQNRAMCQRGCSFGAFFSSVSATLPAARRTGNLTLVSDSHVVSLTYDPETGKATGVRALNRVTRETTEYTARVVFLCASALASLHILLSSASEEMPNGFANSSGALGLGIMDHHFRVGASGTHPGFKDRYYTGRRPNGIYIPRFRNIGDDQQDFVRGYGFQGGAGRGSWRSTSRQKGFGADYKASLRTPADWTFGIGGFGEMLPQDSNRVTLHPTKTDAWGLPQLHIECSLSANDLAMREDMAATAKAMLEAAGLENVSSYNADPMPGLGIHEMGGARMGHDPATSVLGKFNQCHDVQNVFVTDGAAMSSSACQNPSITYMALTARAADYAATQMREGQL